MGWMRAVVVLAAGGVAASGCGGSHATGGSGGGIGALGGSGAVGRGGATGTGGAAGNGAGQSGAGGQIDGGAPDVPLSTGTFPYPGRWWGTLAGAIGDGGVPVDKAAVVIHWSETDTVDRNLWTASGVYPLAVNAASDGSTTVLTSAPDTSACWSIYATSDAHKLQVQPCNSPPSSGTPPLGYLNDVPRLVAEIPEPPLGPDNRGVTVTAGATGLANGGGAWITFLVGYELWYWRADTGQIFDLGQSSSAFTAASPDGRWLLYYGHEVNSGKQFEPLFALDTTTGTATKIAESLTDLYLAPYSQLAMFSPDSRRAAFYANATGVSQADLLAYDFTTGQTTTLAPHVYTFASAASTVAWLASGDRVVFAADDATGTIVTEAIPMYGYDFVTGATMSVGPAINLTPVPGGVYVALQTVPNWMVSGGQVMLLHDESGFAPQVVTDVTFPAGVSAGVWPDPAGTRIAYVTTGNVLNVRGLAANSTPQTLTGQTGEMDLVVGPPSAESGTATRPVAAWFTSDGEIVRQILGNNGDDLEKDDLTTPAAISLPLPVESQNVTTITALGDVLLGGAETAVLVWPNSVATLTSPAASFDYQTSPVFSANDRYLTYQINGDLMVQDFVGSTTTQLAQQLLSTSQVVTSPVSGVSILWHDASTPLEVFAPAGTSSALGLGNPPLMNPSGTAAAFSTSTGLNVMSMQPAATPVVVSNGGPLAITETQVIFRDLDGVCAVALPQP